MQRLPAWRSLPRRPTSGARAAAAAATQAESATALFSTFEADPKVDRSTMSGTCSPKQAALQALSSRTPPRSVSVAEAVSCFKEKANASLQSYLAFDPQAQVPNKDQHVQDVKAKVSFSHFSPAPRSLVSPAPLRGVEPVAVASQTDQALSEAHHDTADEVTKHLMQARDKIEAVEREFAQIMSELAAYGQCANQADGC
ncbi:unnamed protein product [Cladocopium goreaui]|uniref:Retrovirus-related Pol polyprotein from type-1 retrotransposable element R2 n=1 Tax=Cladocopium goreaui TaxID=2562237 RepID=A0A9P1DAE0_9DINO|nr:unnamed protein product [Cladocopium goreaui]